jgi:hypothetical protein
MFPDLLGCGSYPFLIVSDRVVDLWVRERITGYMAYECRIADIQESSLSMKSAPRYYVIEINGRCELGVNPQIGSVVYERREDCGQAYLSTGGADVNPFLISSWDGQDLFRDANAFPSVSLCVNRVRDLTHAFGLTNFQFDLTTVNGAIGRA